MADDTVRQVAAANGVALSVKRAMQLQPLWEGHQANVTALDQLRDRLQLVAPAGTLHLPRLPATSDDTAATPGTAGVAPSVATDPAASTAAVPGKAGA